MYYSRTTANESVGVIKEEELTSAVAAVDAPSEGGGGEVSLDMLETVKGGSTQSTCSACLHTEL